MGEMADAALEGEACEMCGVFFEDEAPGHPRLCKDCEEEESE